jgi:hypothetical protein
MPYGQFLYYLQKKFTVSYKMAAIVVLLLVMQKQLLEVDVSLKWLFACLFWGDKSELEEEARKQKEKKREGKSWREKSSWICISVSGKEERERERERCSGIIDMANWRLLMKLMIMAAASMDALTRALEQLATRGRSPYSRRRRMRRIYRIMWSMSIYTTIWSVISRARRTSQRDADRQTYLGFWAIFKTTLYRRGGRPLYSCFKVV